LFKKKKGVDDVQYVRATPLRGRQLPKQRAVYLKGANTTIILKAFVDNSIDTLSTKTTLKKD